MTAEQELLKSNIHLHHIIKSERVSGTKRRLAIDCSRVLQQAVMIYQNMEVILTIKILLESTKQEVTKQGFKQIELGIKGGKSFSDKT